MRLAYDNPGHHSLEPRPQLALGSSLLGSCELHHIVPASPSLADADGQIRTSTDTATRARHADGVWASVTAATLWMQEPT